MVAAELGDPGVMARIHHRVRVQKLANAWPAQNNPEVAAWKPARSDDRDEIFPVLGEDTNELRIVLDDKHAIYAVWIARGDARRVPVIDLALDGEPGAIVKAGGIVTQDEGRGEQVLLGVVTPAFEMHGWVDGRAIGEVWIARPTEKQHATHKLADKTPIRAQPRSTAKLLATSRELAYAAVIGASRDGWQEVSLDDPSARVHGFVPASAVSDDLTSSGTGSGFGIGISDTDHLVVAKGTCLFDSAGGEVMGVETVEEDRYAYRPNAEHPGWWRVFLSTPWGAQIAWVHEGESLCANAR